MKRLNLKNISARALITCLCVHVLMSFAYAETIVNAGLLTMDTIWTGEVVVNGVVEVDAGVTLELRPGTNVRFTTAFDGIKPFSGLIVYGTLNAVGEQDNPIRFFGENRHPGAWQGLSVKMGKGSPSVMRYCRIEDALTGLFGHSAELLAEEVEFIGNTTGITADSGFKLELRASRIALNTTGLLFMQNAEATVHHNRIVTNHDAGLVLQGSSPSIKGNTIEDNGKVGIACYRGSSPEISDNLITDNNIGLLVEMMSSPRIVHNEIRDNETGASFGKMTFAQVEYNLINKNDVGLFCNYSAYPEIHYNNLEGNREYALDLGPKQSSRVSQMGPFMERNGEFVSRTGPLKLRKHDNVSGQPLYIPDDGIIKASHNWWGEQVNFEMQESGADANISVIEDYYDENNLSFKGTIYERDRFGYAPWINTPPEEAGVRVLPSTNVENLNKDSVTTHRKD